VDEPSLLSDVNRWVGVTIALIGSIVVAPGGALLLWRTATDWMRRQRALVRAKLSRVLPFLHREHRVVFVDAAGASTAVGTVTVTGSGSGWSSAESVDDRIDRLRQQILDVDRRLGGVEQRVAKETQDRRKALAKLEEALRAEGERPASAPGRAGGTCGPR
jgi:hypothetical protein